MGAGGFHVHQCGRSNESDNVDFVDVWSDESVADLKSRYDLRITISIFFPFFSTTTTHCEANITKQFHFTTILKQKRKRSLLSGRFSDHFYAELSFRS